KYFSISSMLWRLFYVFGKGPPGLVRPAFVFFPQGLYLYVLFLFGVGFDVNDAVVNEFLHHFVENERRYAFTLPFGQDAYQQQFHAVVVLLGFEQVIPAERKQASPGFLQSRTHIWNGYPKSDHIALIVQHAT